MPDRSKQWWSSLLEILERELQTTETSEGQEGWALLRAEVRALAEPLYRRFGGELPIEVDDLAQEVMLRLQSPAALRRLRAAGSAEGYLTVVMRNHLLDLLRRSRLERRWQSAQTSPRATPDAPPQEDLITLRRALARLPADDQELILRRFWREQTIAEIANDLGEKYSTVSVRLFRLLRRLERMMAP